ncbi:alpha/beta hydrolase [Diaphorobacter ruginosibacter]|uniref:Alpha/beta hydrolase n=1 Tax=Diaphorobacter ruginosibacter TaxID=1715720 RepID=A0A7G9RJA5_9BURK|nr:alpha/beta fold hydrolase [Diaphorobacter ruginosibacter]QNN55680.1 alpha/beta hydrolase [Diaphorobacter ruginosibacter]
MTNRYPDDITFVLVPGLRDHVEDHWQTHLQKELQDELQRAVTVPPLEHDKLSREARVQALVRTLDGVQGPVVLVAHSAGVMTTVHWALRSAQQSEQQHGRPILGALLATPADVEEPMPAGYPTVDQLQSHGWTPIPRQRLPFPAWVAASRNDPLASYARAEQMSRDWGAELVDLGEVGHLNPAAGFGKWPGVHALLRRLVA